MTSGIQTQLGTKANLSGAAFTGTVSSPTVVVGGWTVTEVSGVLKFSKGGVSKMSLDGFGNLIVSGDVTAYGTV